LPYKHLEANKTIQETVQVGKTSKYQLTAAALLGWRLRFPGRITRAIRRIDRAARTARSLAVIFQENVRNVNVRMQQQAAETMRIEAQGGHAPFTAGHSFDLTRHPSDDGQSSSSPAWSIEASSLIGTHADDQNWT